LPNNDSYATEELLVKYLYSTYYFGWHQFHFSLKRLLYCKNTCTWLLPGSLRTST